MIRLARPDIDEADIEAVANVLRSGDLVQGARVAEFERALAARVGVPHVAAVCNGTAALQLSLLALDIGPGDRVAVPTFSWPATANSVVLTGATPVFVDIESRTLGMDPGVLESVLSRTEGIRAVVAVHAFGRMAEIAELTRVCEARGVPLVEDAACALGAATGGRSAGAWGALGTFSFHPRKAATTGEGGAIACQDPSFLRRVRVLRNHGLDPESPIPDFVDVGFNMRLTEFQAALGSAQLARFDAILADRRHLAGRYRELLRGLPVTLPDPGDEREHAYQAYVILLDPALRLRRNAVIAELRDAGIETTIGTYHIPHLSFFRRELGHGAGDHPIGESVAARAIALPLHSMLQASDQALVVRALAEALAR